MGNSIPWDPRLWAMFKKKKGGRELSTCIYCSVLCKCGCHGLAVSTLTTLNSHHYGLYPWTVSPNLVGPFFKILKIKLEKNLVTCQYHFLDCFFQGVLSLQLER